jgi:hypothetical protein
MSNPAERLQGLTLNGEWVVGAMEVRSAGATGGNFSCCYSLTSTDGKRKAYLKALDYKKALRAPNPSIALQALTESFNYEVRLCERCRGLDHVVHIIGRGQVEVDPAADTGLVDYLILERGVGDIRSVMQFCGKMDLAFSLRTLHHAAVGLQELHGVDIKFLDMKPSNILVVPTPGTDVDAARRAVEAGNALLRKKAISKVTDLGRSADGDSLPPHVPDAFPGDPRYAPPEQLYRWRHPDQEIRWRSADMYMFGNFCAFMLCGANVTALTFDSMPDEFHWSRPNVTFEQVFEYLRDAYGKARLVIADDIAEWCRASMMEMLDQLCEPDPLARGDRMKLGRAQYSLERYISRLDVLASRAESNIRHP